MADQPLNAANLTEKLQVAYELFEVRSGLGLKPIHRLGDKAPSGTLEAMRVEAHSVLEKARGPDGEAKRANAQKIAQALAAEWADGGRCWGELKKILNSVL